MEELEETICHLELKRKLLLEQLENSVEEDLDDFYDNDLEANDLNGDDEETKVTYLNKLFIKE